MSGCSQPVRNDGHMFERWADDVAAIPIDDGSHASPAKTAQASASPPGRSPLQIDLIDHPDSKVLGLRTAVAMVDSEIAGLRRRFAPAQAASTPDTAPAEAAASPAKTFMAQLAAYPTRRAAEGAWARLKAAHPDALGTLSARFEPVDLGARGVWTRLQAGPMATRDQASAVCAEAGVTDRWCVSPSHG